MNRSASNPAYVAIACGGTGGHLFPGLAVGSQLVQRGVSVSLLVSPKDVDQQAVRTLSGMDVITLPAVALQGGRWFAFLRGFVQSWLATRKQFQARRPDAVLAMGGFTSAPPVLVARRAGAKIFLHESNTIPGRANRWLARFADHVFIGFPQAATRLHAREITTTGTPVRPEFRPRFAGACRAALGFDPVRPVILIMGGSQGATAINNLVIAALPQLAARLPQVQWLHLTGSRDEERVRQAYAKLKLKAVVQPFLREMEQVLAAATTAVNRAGASSLAEFAAMRVPAILVPFPHAADEHQLNNARAFSDSGAARLLEQSDASPARLVEHLVELVEQSVAREKIQNALAAWHFPLAAENIAGIILTVLKQRVSIPAQGEEPRLGNEPFNLSVIQ